MSEYTNPQEEYIKGGHLPNMDNAKLELHRLLAIFLSSKSFSDLVKDPTGEKYDPILDIQEFESDEITRILLYLSILARVIDDRENRFFKVLATNCGYLYKGKDLLEKQDLSLREACNKIIHATKISSDIDKSSQPPHLNPVMYFYGTDSGKDWKAELNVIEFAKKYTSVVCKF
jgi:predicted nucleic-acid-binding Zn-ribbon protein